MFCLPLGLNTSPKEREKTEEKNHERKATDSFRTFHTTDGSPILEEDKS